MPFTLTMPKLSPTMDEGTIVKWHKKIGDSVQSGDVLIEVATDKATVEYPALDEGYLRQILIQEGQEAVVNQPIAILTVDQKESIKGYQPVLIQSSADSEPQQKAEQIIVSNESLIESSIEIVEVPKKKIGSPPSQLIREALLKSEPIAQSLSYLEKRILASPLAKKLAKEKGLDLSSVKGTGPNQRVMSRDLAHAQPLRLSPFSFRNTPTLPAGSYEEQALSPMRKIIGQRLQESKSFIPHFYITQSIDAEQLVAIRDQLKVHDLKLSINDFIVKACALALRQHSIINTGFNSVNQTIIQFKTIDIAIAVSLDAGLITPIIRHADHKNIRELSAEVRSLAQRAREGKLEMSEYKGGSFTISNLGMYGISEFQAILNPPQAAILAISGIQDVPVIRNHTIIPGKILNLTLSVDHRVIDGVAAALFLQTIKKLLENPSILLID